MIELIVNFGGPRSQEEIFPFLKELLTDPAVIRTPLPRFLARWVFTRTARRRAKQVAHDYARIGGASPIYADTEALADALGGIAFHRYLPATHPSFLERLRRLEGEEITVFPLFPQFSETTTGSVERFFAERLPQAVVARMRWVRSYADHPRYVEVFQRTVRAFLDSHGVRDEEACLLFSPHGLPQAYVDAGDPYEAECRRSFHSIASAFPRALCLLSYQSKFGRGEWLRPYTEDVCKNVQEWHQGRRHIVLVPLSFTSDHIETLFEVEYQYLPLIRSRGLSAYRCPALNRRADWIDAIRAILQERARL
jgi:ferrochelatase